MTEMQLSLAVITAFITASGIVVAAIIRRGNDPVGPISPLALGALAIGVISVVALLVQLIAIRDVLLDIDNAVLGLDEHLICIVEMTADPSFTCSPE